ncbi:hypothetical protein K439DRAFT_1624271 [Ramaria rubella]|nr:hypothetical protein K439DRAFT_1624271 [Ramaria rubella]
MFLPPPQLLLQEECSSRDSGELQTHQLQSATDGTSGIVIQGRADTDTFASCAVEDIMSKIALTSKDLKVERNPSKDEHWLHPKWARGFVWSENVASLTPSATSTETTKPLPPVPASDPVNQTINSCPDLFRIVTPIDVNKFEALLSPHPNRPLVDSVCLGLHEGFWPFAAINPEHPLTNDSTH